MKLFILVVVAFSLSACAAVRVMVKDCQDIKGLNGEKNCELIKKLN